MAVASAFRREAFGSDSYGSIYWVLHHEGKGIRLWPHYIRVVVFIAIREERWTVSKKKGLQKSFDGHGPMVKSTVVFSHCPFLSPAD